MRLRRWLDRDRPWRWAALLALLVGAPALGFGLQADDHLLRANVSGDWAAIGTAPWDLFHFYDASAVEVIARGLAPWWSSMEASSRLFRPLSSLLHAVELSLWPGQPWLMHLHSLAWYAALCALAALLYRRLIAGWAAGLASLFYVIDFTHGPPMAWIANRNALIAGTFGLAALALHRRCRADGSRIAGAAAPLCLALAFAGGEVALAACAFLLAHALCLETEPRLRRLLALWPYGLVVAGWVAVYAAGDFGARDNGAYLDPVASPLEFLAALPERAVLQIGSEVGGPLPDFWMVLSPPARLGLTLISAASCLLALVALLPLLRRDPVARFFGLGSLLAVLPVCAAFPGSRLMLIPGFGLVGLVAMLLQGWIDRAPWLPRARSRKLITATFAVLAGGSHLLLSPPLLLLSQRQVEIVDRATAELDAGLPAAGLTDKQLVLVNPPDLLIVLYLLPRRATYGQSQPRGMLWLGQGTHDLELTRTGPRTLIVRDRRGFYGDGFSALARPPTMPLPAGSVIPLAGATVRVLAATAGVPTEVEVELDEPLESPGLVWRQWDGQTLVPFAPPPVGETVVLPARDHPLLDPARFP